MDVPQRGFRILRIGIGRAAIILSPPENLQCVYRPLQELCQDFGRRRYCLRCAILLDADNGWRCLADLIAFFDVHQVAIGIADLAIDVQLQRLDGQLLLFLVSRLAGKSLRIDHTGQGLHLWPVVVGSIFQPRHLALAQTAQR